MSIVIDSAAARKALLDLEADFLSTVRQILGQTTAFALELARRTSKFKDGPEARLRKSIVRGVHGTWATFVHAGGAAAPHAKFVEDGTREHVIEGNDILHFVWNGVPVFFRRVHHHGTQATHFMLEARDEAEDAAARFIGDGLTELFR